MRIRRHPLKVKAYGARRPRWNGEPCDAVRAVVLVAPSEPGWWCESLLNQPRKAVVITYHGQRFILDDEDGSAYQKITTGRGSPSFQHRNLPNGSVLLKALPWGRLSAEQDLMSAEDLLEEQDNKAYKEMRSKQ